MAPGTDSISGVTDKLAVEVPDGPRKEVNFIIPTITAINNKITVNMIITRERVFENNAFIFSFLPAIAL